MKIAVGAMGGTIAMASGAEAGLVPTLDADGLTAAVPALQELGELSTHQIANVGSPSVTFEHVLAAHQWASQMIASGADGVVLTHGTDTLEETAFLLDLMWEHETPIVVTGAMRAPDDPGADGPANLLAAARVAISPEARGKGVLVTINDEIFAARYVRKTHTFAMQAFTCPGGTALGRVLEDQVELVWQPARQRPAAIPVPANKPRVAVVGAGIGEDGSSYQAAAAAADGLVINGVGAGHVSGPAADVVEQIAKQIPVVMTSRTGQGRTGRTTYAYPGAEVDLIRRGVIMAGSLSSPQARLLLWAMLGNGWDYERIRQEFVSRG